MPFKSRLFRFLLILAVLFPAPRSIAQEMMQNAQARGFEPFVTRMRDQFALTDDQVASIRKTLDIHAPRITSLRARGQAPPYSARFLAEVESEQRAIRDEFVAVLTDEQKSKLGARDLLLPIVVMQPFVLINIAPRLRTDAATTSPLAATERLLPAVTMGEKGRPPRMTEDQRVLHLLNRATFGPRPGDVERVARIGIDKFLDEQLNSETIDDLELERRLAVLPTLQMSSSELYQFYPPGPIVEQRAKDRNSPSVFGTPRQILGELVQQKLVRAVSSNRQLQEVMTDFWFNHFNVFGLKDADQWLLTGYERDVIRPLALGKFRDLLLGVSRSPAMLFYLDNWLSASSEARQPRPPAPVRLPNLGPRQEALSPTAGTASKGTGGLAMTNEPTGTSRQPISDSELRPIARPQSMPGQTSEMPNRQTANPNPPTPPRPPARRPGINENFARELLELHTMGVEGGYSQKDVQEVARCFTGWTIERPVQAGAFTFKPWMHDSGEKKVLGATIPAGGGMSDGVRVIELLSRHPSTARFISRKLCRRFVSDSPSPVLVERVAQVFIRTDGDIREVLRAIFKSPEFNSAQAFRSKIKSPLELVASALRALDGDTNGSPALHDWLRKMGEPLYVNPAPTGYSEESGGWLNSGAFLNRLSFTSALSRNQIAGTRIDPFRLVPTDDAASIERLADRLTALVAHTELSSETRQAIRAGLGKEISPPTAAAHRTASSPSDLIPKAAAVREQRPDQDSARRIVQFLELLLGAPEFQRR